MSKRFDEIGRLVKQSMVDHATPGVVVGVLQGGKSEVRGYGVTNVNHPLKVTPDTLFQVGSISKTYTATLMMHLAEQGKLDLHAPLRSYLPEFRVRDEGAAANATCWHLLTHTSGWVGDHFIDTGEGADALPAYVQRMADLEQIAPQGAIPSYCNSGFYLAGALIEHITGQPFERTMQEMIFDPLGLTRSFYRPMDVMVHRFAVGHERGEHGPQVDTPWYLPRAVYPVGGIVCSVGDLLRYAAFHIAGGRNASGEQRVSGELIGEMQRKQMELSGWADGVGLSWFLKRYGDVMTIQHSGGTTGQISLLHIAPDQGFAYAIVTNGGEGGQVTRRVGERIMAEYLGVTRPAPQPISATPQQLADLVGRYTRPFADLTLWQEGEQLRGGIVFKQGFPTAETPPSPPPPPFAVAMADDGQLLVLDGAFKDATAQIIRDELGQIIYIRFGGRLHRRVG